MATFKRPKLYHRGDSDRTSPREAVRIFGTCAVGERAVEETWVTDLTPGGCKLRLVTIGVTKSEPVTLRIGDEEPIAGRLKWIKQGSLGIAFDTVLDEALVERLLAIVPPDNVVPLPRSLKG